MYRLAGILAAVALTPGALSATYQISDTFIGTSFLDGFSHEAISDPTHGRVSYVDQGTAQALNLTYASGNTLILRADATSMLSPYGPGRASVRIKSNKAYSTHVAVFDVRHMPEGCGTWPAAWETDEVNWPYWGEVDIIRFRRIEGVNSQSPNSMAVHTASACTMPAGRGMTGTPLATDCNVYTDGNSGCTVLAPTGNSFGPAFNANGGGWYAIERTSSFVRVFFWPRYSGVPSDVASGSSSVNTDAWGTPVALFPSTPGNCDVGTHFGPNNIIINLTFCGDWAGIPSIYNGAGCPGSCVDFVNGNPGAFSNAYWDIASLRVYQ